MDKLLELVSSFENENMELFKKIDEISFINRAWKVWQAYCYEA